MPRPSFVKEEEIVSLSKTGLNSYKISAKTGVDLTWVRKILKSNGIQTPAREREREVQSRIDANERGKSEEKDRTQKRKKKKMEGLWEIPTIMSKSLELKTTPEQDKILLEYYYAFRAISNFAKYREAKLKEEKSKERYSHYVPEYRQWIADHPRMEDKLVNMCATQTNVFVRSFVNTTIPSAIRGINLKSIAFPVDGRNSPNTSTNIGVTKRDKKYYYILDNNEFEILYDQDKKYYSERIDHPLYDDWDRGFIHGGIVRKAKNGKWYLCLGIPRTTSYYTWNEQSEKIYMMICPTYDAIGIVWRAKFYNAKNELVFVETLLHPKSTIRLLPNKKDKDYVTHYTRKAVDKLFRTWMGRFSLFRPVVILQETIGTPPSKEVENINPIYKLQLSLINKLAGVNGTGGYIQKDNVPPFDVIGARRTLKI